MVRRLLDEEQCMGINVRRDLQAKNLEPHIWTEQLIEFYRDTKAFLYETSVWNRTPLKQKYRSWIGQYLASWQTTRKVSQPLRILCFGDGLGFDSTFFCQAGHEVTYFEVSQKCQAFATKVFEGNAVCPRIVDRLDGLAPDSFDAIVCMDVLEHVPSPPDVVESFSRWLKPGGRLIVHSPFWLIARYYSTHLRKNRKYSGSLNLFRRHQLEPVGGNFFWDPIVFEHTSQARSLPLAMKIGRLLLCGARYESSPYCFLAKVLSRRDSRWQKELMHDVERMKPVP